LVDLLQPINFSVVEKAIFVLVDISSQSASYRNKIIEKGGLINLIKIIKCSDDKDLINQCYWALSILCRGSLLPMHDSVK
jgi:hypothetical protein